MKTKRSLVFLTLAAGVAILLMGVFFHEQPVLRGLGGLGRAAKQDGDVESSMAASKHGCADRGPSTAWEVVPGFAELAARLQELKRDWDDAGRVGALEQEWKNTAADRREQVLAVFVANLDQAVIEQLLARLGDIVPEEMCPDLQQALLTGLARLDPSRAASLAEELGERGELLTANQTKLFFQIAGQWAQTDPPAAAKWAMGLAPGPVREGTIQSLAERFMNEDPSTASELIAALSAGQVKLDLMDRLVANWGGQDFEAALTWAKGLPDGADKARSLMHLSYNWEGRDPRGALEFAERLPQGQDSLVVSLAGRWVQRDAKAAAAWAAALPEGRRREKVIASMTAGWAGRDLRGAGKFVSSLPPGRARDDAVISMVSAWSAQDPAAAARWVEQLPPGRLRDYAVENVAYWWAQSDPTQAAAWSKP
ncbi:MAG: hypothetical protein ACE15E_09445 [Acidobacteriota bacterium]